MHLDVMVDLHDDGFMICKATQILAECNESGAYLILLLHPFFWIVPLAILVLLDRLGPGLFHLRVCLPSCKITVGKSEEDAITTARSPEGIMIRVSA